MNYKDYIGQVDIFFDRKTELNVLTEHLSFLRDNKPKKILLTGYRRIGKTHLIWKHFKEINKKNYIPIYIDCLTKSSWKEIFDSIYKKTIETYLLFKKDDKQILKQFLSNTIKDTYSFLKQVEISIGKENLGYLNIKLNNIKNIKKEDFINKTISALEEFSNKKNIKLVIALDEFQVIQKMPDLELMIAKLRSRLQVVKNIEFIFSGSKPSFFKEYMLYKSKPFFQQITVFEVEPFSKEVVEEIFKKFKLNKEKINKIFDFTKGIPDYVMKLLDYYNKYKDVDKAINSVLLNEKRNIEYILEMLTYFQKSILKKIAKGKKYSEIKKEINAEVSSTLKYLINDGYIKKKSVGKYSLIDPIMERYFLETE
jgi:hypothetical protein